MHPWSIAAVRWLLIFAAMAAVARSQEARLVEKAGRVVVTKSGARPIPAVVGIALVSRDKLGTGGSSRAVLKMSERWFARIDEETDIEITPGAFAATSKDSLKMALGGAFIYSREEEGELKMIFPSATGGLRGTQLVVRVWPDGKTFLQVIEGQVDFANEIDRVLLNAGEAGEAEVGRAPRKTAAIKTRDLLQWTLYYPAVLQPEELGLTAAEQRDAAASLDAYRRGDLLGALEQYPAGYVPASDGAKSYRAAVLLATGRVDAARLAIRDVPMENSARRAVERMMAAVLSLEQPTAGEMTTAGEALAESYYQQSRRKLEAARSAAKRATGLAPKSGFAWTRLAELEFSFGRTREARAALENGLALAAQNAQAHALRGFLLSAEYRIDAAREAFEEAVRLDGGLGNAWLGLGLTKIKQGAWEEGRSDLQTAVTVEPTRSFFYSYHGKALSAGERSDLARKDLKLARQFDPADPTPWLYSAIENQQDNRYNEAVGEMEESLRLNDNRRVYRSQFLLDQDRAVRRSNLAKIYQNNGMAELAVREATRAVEHDYSNPSAHLFLANSFDALRDPRQLALRFETAWFNELLLAHLLAPVGGGSLSQFVSQQEYSKLLDADGVGVTSITEWRERGQLDQQLSLFGTKGRLSFALDFAYHDDPGFRPNNDTLRKESYGQLKYQVSPDDVFYALGKWQDQRNGDLRQSHDNLPFNFAARYEDKQEPGLLLLGWNRRWAPGVHTLFLGGRLAANETFVEPGSTGLLLERAPLFLQPGFLRRDANNVLEYASAGLRSAIPPPLSSAPSGALAASDEFRGEIAPFLGRAPVTGVFTERLDLATQRKFVIYSAELQHLWQASRNTVIAGARAQAGDFDTRVRLGVVNRDAIPFFTAPAALQSVSVDFMRVGIYAYDFFTLKPWLTLLGGAAWDRVERPENFRQPPVSDRQITADKTSGKLGFTLTPWPSVTIRGLYSESLGGVTFDESVRLEPVQLAGFNQAFRTVISESIVGSVEAPIYKNWALSVAGATPTKTWWSGSFNRLDEDVAHTVGAFDIFNAPLFPNGTVVLPASTTETFAYREDVFAAGINQLIGNELSIGAGYRHTRAELRSRFPQVPVAVSAAADRLNTATLREAGLYANWNAPSGWFARAEATHYAQKLDTFAGGARLTSPPGDNFWQLSAQLGYRFRRNRREVSGGVLNLTDRDNRLSPLTYTRELPHKRTFFVRCRVNI